MVAHAASGDILGNDKAIPNGSLLCSTGNDLLCLVQKNGIAELYRYSVDSSNTLIVSGQLTVSQSLDKDNYFTAIAEGTASAAIGTAGGSLIFVGRNRQIQVPAVGEQTLITEAEISGQNIAFLTENGAGFIPADFNRLTANQVISMEQNKENYNRIAAFESEAGGGFIFWNDRTARAVPVIRNFAANHEGETLKISGINFRSPIHSVSSLNGKILFLESAGNLAVLSPGSGNKPFTFFSMGLMDAAFISNTELILARSAVSGNSPFLTLNINTGETVSLPYPYRAGVKLYRGVSGAMYAVAISSQLEQGGTMTSILQLNFADSTGSVKLVDHQGEDIQFSLAESPGGLAATIGGEGAAIYSASRKQNLERAAGFPRRLINGGRYLINLDMDGNILWHDGNSGKLLAVFRLSPSGWTLQTEQRTVSGGFNVPQ
jgi:hypothetical protein